MPTLSRNFGLAKRPVMGQALIRHLKVDFPLVRLTKGPIYNYLLPLYYFAKGSGRGVLSEDGGN